MLGLASDPEMGVTGPRYRWTLLRVPDSYQYSDHHLRHLDRSLSSTRPRVVMRPYPSGMRILVTGGAGYVGSVSVERLLEAGHDVTVLDNLATGHRGSVPDGTAFVDGSFGDGDLVRRTLEESRIDAVLHCAAKSLVGESMQDPAAYYRHNVVGGVALLDAMRDADVARLVFSSTAAVYGVPDATPIREDAPLRPINTYGETKRTFEGSLVWYGVAYVVRSARLRYFNVA